MVFPVPGGPYRITEAAPEPSTSRRSGEPGAAGGPGRRPRRWCPGASARPAGPTTARPSPAGRSRRARRTGCRTRLQAYHAAPVPDPEAAATCPELRTRRRAVAGRRSRRRRGRRRARALPDGPGRDAERGLLHQSGPAHLLGGGPVQPGGRHDQLTQRRVVRGIGLRAHDLGRGDHRMRKVALPQQVSARGDHQRGDVGDRVTGRRRRAEPGHLLGQHRGEHMVLGGVIAVERAKRHPGVGRDLLGADPVEFPHGAQPGGGRENRTAPALLVVGHRSGRRPGLRCAAPHQYRRSATPRRGRTDQRDHRHHRGRAG